MTSMENKILHWLANGKVGISSKAMALSLLGVEILSAWDRDTPSDPDDLNRCLLFLEAVPEAREHFDKIAAISPQWAKLVENWAQVESLYLSEAGLNWLKAQSAPKTYKLMASLGC